MTSVCVWTSPFYRSLNRTFYSDSYFLKATEISTWTFHRRLRISVLHFSNHFSFMLCILCSTLSSSCCHSLLTGLPTSAVLINDSRSLGSSETLSRCPQGQNYIHKNTKMLFAIFTVLTFVPTVQKTTAIQLLRTTQVSQWQQLY